MRVLLDECVPRQLRRDLEGFDVRTVRDMGWSGVKNGALLDLAGEHFDAVFTGKPDRLARLMCTKRRVASQPSTRSRNMLRVAPHSSSRRRRQ